MKEKKTHAPEEPLAHIPPATASQQRLEKLRAHAHDFALMSESSTDAGKRELLRRLAEQLALEALELEQIVKKQEGH